MLAELAKPGSATRRAGLALLAAALVACAVSGGVFLAEFGWFLSHASLPIQRDFTAFYFLADALRHRLDPNIPLPELGARLGFPGLTLFPHPTPHPPTAGLLLLPFTGIGLSAAGVCWLLVGFGALTGSVHLLGKVVGSSIPAWLTLPVALALTTWQPVKDDLSWGNINALLLLLLAAVILCFRAKRDLLAGGLFAIALLLKPIAWPVLLLLAFRRQWASVLGCSIVGGMVGLATLAVIGPTAAVGYFTRSLPAATQFYEHDFYNFSLARLGTRLFEGVDFPRLAPHLHFAPVLEWPEAAAVLCPVITVLAVVSALAFTRRCRLEGAIGTMICVSVAVSPTTWTHYLMLALVPIAIIASSLRERSWPMPLTARSMALFALIATPLYGWIGMATKIEPIVRPPDTYWPVGASFVALVPTYLLVGLTILTVVAERGREPAKTEQPATASQHPVVGRRLALS